MVEWSERSSVSQRALVLTQGHRLRMVTSSGWRQWLIQTYKERQFDVLSRFKMVSRFIDDLKAFNSRRAIGELKAEIYGPLHLTRSAEEDGSGAHFLDMDVLISGGMVHVRECTTRGTPSIQAMWTRSRLTPA